MSFLLTVTHTPTGEVSQYTWPASPDPAMTAAQGMFYQGFACGWYAHAFPEGGPEDLLFEPTEVQDGDSEPSESPSGMDTPVGVTTYASGHVTHPETPSDDE